MAVLLHFIIFLISILDSPAIADPLYFTDGNKGKFISNSTYSSNLNLLFSSLSSNASIAAGFATTTAGSIPDSVYGLTLCRGDTDSASCRSCVYSAVSDIQMLCKNCMEANIWYDDCQLRYSNQDFLHAPDVASDIQILMFNEQNVSAGQLFQFEFLSAELMGNLTDLAVRNTSRLFATGETVLAAGNVVYGLVQCARDLSIRDCRNCLETSVDTINKEPLKGRKGGRTLGLWCNMRYEFYKFYNGTSMLQFSSHLLPSSPSPLSPPSPSSLPSSLSPPSVKQNNTHSPVDSSHGGPNRVDIVLAITISVVVAFVRIEMRPKHAL